MISRSRLHGANWSKLSAQELGALKSMDDLISQIVTKCSLEKRQVLRDADAALKQPRDVDKSDGENAVVRFALYSRLYGKLVVAQRLVPPIANPAFLLLAVVVAAIVRRSSGI